MLFKATVVSIVPAAPLLPPMETVRLAVEQRAGPAGVADVDVDDEGDDEVDVEEALLDVGGRVVEDDDDPDEHAASPALRARAATTPTNCFFIHNPF